MSKQMAARQLFILTFGLTIGTSVLVIPSGLALVAREDAWIASLVSALGNLLMVVLYIALSRRYPGKTLFEMNEAAFGKWAGKAVSLLYLFYYLMLAGTLVGNLGFFVTSEILEETPIQAVQLLFLAVVVICAKLGIIVLARIGELFFPWIIFFFLLLVLSLLPQVEWNYIMPIMEAGWKPVLTAAYHASMFQELVIMLGFIPLVRDAKAAEKGYLAGAGLGGILLMLVVLLSVLILGIEQSANSTFPTYALAKTINIGNFLQRVEGMLITLWVLTFFLKSMLVYFSILSGIRTVFGMASSQTLVYPLAALIIVVAWNTYVNFAYIGTIIRQVWPGYSLIHLVVLPLLIFAAGLFRKRKPLQG